jgi:Xaa-Pro aminopeptidase
MQGANAQKVDSTQRLAKLRELMSKKDNSVNAIVVPSQDQRKFIAFAAFDLA